MNKKIFDIIQSKILSMSDAEFKKAIDEAVCSDLRWMLEYAWDLQLDEFAQWKICFRYMWE